MRTIEISDFNAADEFVVEAMMQDGKFKVIGKVIIDNNLLNDDDWKPSGIMPTGRRTAMKRWLSLMECIKA